jgi:hypothetical protein
MNMIKMNQTDINQISAGNNCTLDIATSNMLDKVFSKCKEKCEIYEEKNVCKGGCIFAIELTAKIMEESLDIPTLEEPLGFIDLS